MAAISVERLGGQQDEAIHSLKCQYLQLVEPRDIEFPPINILQQPEFQEVLYTSLFSPAARIHTPARYTARVLKLLISLLEDSPETELNPNLLALYLSPSTLSLPTDKSHVTYTLPSPLAPITLLENPYLISGLGTTGLRTWEAALALSENLILSPPPPPETRVLELGAGTGLVSLTIARLGVTTVLATDGDLGVCNTLQENVRINGLLPVVRVQRRLWGGARQVPDPVDLVVGADVTYDAAAIPFLVAELVYLFSENVGMRAVISATVRNEDTFAVFRDSCAERGLRLVEDIWKIPEKRVFWYKPKAEIRIIQVFREH